MVTNLPLQPQHFHNFDIFILANMSDSPITFTRNYESDEYPVVRAQVYFGSNISLFIPNHLALEVITIIVILI